MRDRRYGLDLALRALRSTSSRFGGQWSFNQQSRRDPENDRPAVRRRDPVQLQWSMSCALRQYTSSVLMKHVSALSQGISVLPPNENGRKSPLVEPTPQSCDHPDCVAQRRAGKETGWMHRQHRRAGESHLKRWFQKNIAKGSGWSPARCPTAFSYLSSEGRAIVDGTFDLFLDLAEELGLADLIEEIRNGYEDLPRRRACTGSSAATIRHRCCWHRSTSAARVRTGPSGGH